jgi:hypothetical protein
VRAQKKKECCLMLKQECYNLFKKQSKKLNPYLIKQYQN